MWYPIRRNQEFITGDIIETNTFIPPSFLFPFAAHYAIVFYKDGVPYVTHNPFQTLKKVKGFDPLIEPLESFRKNRKLMRFFRNEQTMQLTDEYIENKAIELINSGKYFKSFIFNCEDYIRDISGVRLGFDQRNAMMFILILLLIIVFVGNMEK